jgi:O-antigen/teichoic acid export membrane protein
MNGNYDIDFDEKSARQSIVFAIIIGLIGFALYSQEVVQRSDIRGGEWIFPILYAGLSGLIGFISGLTFFKSKNQYGLFTPFIVFLIHSTFFGNKQGDDLKEFLFQIGFLLISLFIAFIIPIVLAYLSTWVKQGK